MAWKMTERELALINGKDPDEVAAPEVEATPEVETPSLEAPEQDAQAEEITTEQEAEVVEPVAEEQEAEVDTEVPADWFSDEDKEYAQSYGISEEDLRAFPNRGAFRQAASVIDKQTVQLGRPAEEAKGEPEAKKEDLIPIDPDALAAEGYDEKVVGLAKAMKAEREARLAERESSKKELEEIKAYHAHIQQQELQQAHVRKVHEFHDALDSQEESLFGRSVDASGKPKPLTTLEDANRRAVYEAAEELREGIIARAQKLGKQPEVPSTKVLVQRAAQMVLGQDLLKIEREKHTKQLAAQAAKRRPVGATKPTASAAAHKSEPLTLEEQVKAIANSPAVVKAWENPQ